MFPSYGLCAVYEGGAIWYVIKGSMQLVELPRKVTTKRFLRLLIISLKYKILNLVALGILKGKTTNVNYIFSVI